MVDRTKDIFGGTMVIDAVGCRLSPKTIADFVADQVQWSACSDKIVIMDPPLLQALRAQLPYGVTVCTTSGGTLVFFDLYAAGLDLHVRREPGLSCQIFSIPVQSDRLCEANTIWVIDVGDHFEWGDGAIWGIGDGNQ